MSFFIGLGIGIPFSRRRVNVEDGSPYVVADYVDADYMAD